MLRRRRNVAHHIKYMDPVSQQSLGERVCSGDAGLEVSQGQSADYAALAGYLAPFQPFVKVVGTDEVGVGSVMCFLAIFCWAAC